MFVENMKRYLVISAIWHHSGSIHENNCNCDSFHILYRVIVNCSVFSDFECDSAFHIPLHLGQDPDHLGGEGPALHRQGGEGEASTSFILNSFILQTLICFVTNISPIQLCHNI